MSLNVSKFQLLSHKVHVHARNANMRLLLELPFAFTQFFRNYQISESCLLEPSESISDLGVCVSNDFSFEEHINQIAKKANLKCSWVLSVFKSRSSIVLLTTYKSLFRGILEYNCPLWSPTRVQDICLLEAVQRRLTSKIVSVNHLDYWDRLKVLNLMSLQRRRERYILLYMYKIYHELVPNDMDISWLDSGRRGFVAVIPPIPSSVQKMNTSYDNFFKVVGPKLWNGIPPNIRCEQSLANLKAALDSFFVKSF